MSATAPADLGAGTCAVEPGLGRVAGPSEESGGVVRIAVTGAQGKVGRVVVAAATAAGHEVLRLDRVAAPGVEHLDTSDYASFVTKLDGCDALIHLAALPSPWPAPAHEVHANNVVGSYHAFLAAAEVGIERVAWASSINAIGGRFSRSPRFDYFPVDEAHPSYAEDAYSLSKWLGEKQAEAVVRQHPQLRIASIRLHGAWEQRPVPSGSEEAVRSEANHLWGWVDVKAVARAFLLALEADFAGHEAFFVVAPTTTVTTESAELAERFYPGVPIRKPLPGTTGFYDCDKAARILGWTHDATDAPLASR